MRKLHWKHFMMEEIVKRTKQLTEIVPHLMAHRRPIFIYLPNEGIMFWLHCVWIPLKLAQFPKSYRLCMATVLWRHLATRFKLEWIRTNEKLQCNSRVWCIWVNRNNLTLRCILCVFRKIANFESVHTTQSLHCRCILSSVHRWGF